MEATYSFLSYLCEWDDASFVDSLLCRIIFFRDGLDGCTERTLGARHMFQLITDTRIFPQQMSP